MSPSNFPERLSITDAQQLIRAEKHPCSIPEFNDIRSQIMNTITFSPHSYHCLVLDPQRKLKYTFLVHTTPKESIFSVGLMFVRSNYHLIRLDFGPHLRHKNNFGSSNEITIIGSHAHILAPSDKYARKNVIPIAELPNFATISMIKDGLERFIKVTNIHSPKGDSNHDQRHRP